MAKPAVAKPIASGPVDSGTQNGWNVAPEAGVVEHLARVVERLALLPALAR